MALTLHMHPLSSFCWKALIALYESEIPFEPHLVDLGEPVARDAFLKIWPIGKFPVLCDDASGLVLPESTSIIEYLALHHLQAAQLVPADAELARQIRAHDRFFDLNVHIPMQKVVTDKVRPNGMSDPFGVDQAKATMTTAYGLIDEQMATRTWAAGDAFSMADCAAAPALYYANLVHPFVATRPHAARYLSRLLERPSFARVVKEAQPYFAMFPG